MLLGVRGHDFGRNTAEGIAKQFSEMGFSAIQLAPAKCLEGVESIDAIREEDVVALHEAMKKEGMDVAVFGCYVDLSAADEDTRQKAVGRFVQAMRWNKGILHGRMVGSETSYGRPGKIEKRVLFPNLLRSIDKIVEEAERMGTDFALEPVAWHVCEDVETMRELIDRFRSPHFKVIFDLCNVLPRPDLLDQKAYFRYCFELLGKEIAAIHLKDIVLDEKMQQVQVPIGKGVCDYSALAEFLADKPDMPVLREGIRKESAEADLEAMKEIRRRAEQS